MKALEAGKKPAEFDPPRVIMEWAQANNIPEGERDAFVKDAKEVFQMQVIICGLSEGITREKWEAEKARSRQMLFSGTYSLYEPRREVFEELDEV
ncbi:MAG: hypothetical protein ABIK44_06990 [candidate division WOR-3 bacterium]